MASLELTERWMARLATVALAAMTVIIVLGVVAMVQGEATHRGTWWTGKLLGTAIMWVIFAVAGYLRFAPWPSGSTIATLCLAGLGLLLVVMVLSLGGCEGTHGEIRIGSDPTAVDPVEPLPQEVDRD